MTNAPSSNASAGSNSQPASYITKAVYGIAIDPLDDNRFASFGDDMGIRLWDRRRTDPVMTWTEMDAGPRADQRACNVSMIQFSKSRRGVLGSLMKDAHAVRLWDILDHRREVTEQNSDVAEAASTRWSNYQLGRGHSRTTSTTSTAASHAHALPGILPDGPILAHTTTGKPRFSSILIFSDSHWPLQVELRRKSSRHLHSHPFNQPRPTRLESLRYPETELSTSPPSYPQMYKHGAVEACSLLPLALAWTAQNRNLLRRMNLLRFAAAGRPTVNGLCPSLGKFRRKRRYLPLQL